MINPSSNVSSETSSDTTSSEVSKDENSGIPDVELAKGDWSNFAYDREMIRDTVLIPNGLNTWNEERYEMTGYINNINTANTQVLMEFHDKGYAGNIYEYVIGISNSYDKRESVSHWQNTNYYSYDGRGSVSDLVDGTGKVQMYHSYEPDGQTTLRFRGYIKNPYRYNAERVDYVPGIADFQYLRARYYAPNLARFLSQDTVWGNIDVPLKQNLYAYVGNNPINRIDPSGHRALEIDEGGSSYGGVSGSSIYSSSQSNSNTTNGKLNNKVQQQIEIANDNSYYDNCGDEFGEFMDVSGDVMLGILASVMKNLYTTISWYPEQVKSLQDALSQNGFGDYGGMLDGFVAMDTADQIEWFFKSKATDEVAFYGGMIAGDIASIVGGIYGAYLGIMSIVGGAGSQAAHIVPGPGTAVAIGGAAVAVVGVVGAVAGVSLAVSGFGNISSSIDKFDKANSEKQEDWDKVNDKYLKDKGIDAHELKKEILGKKAPIAQYDIYVDKKSGELFIFKKGGKGAGISTGEFIK